MRNAQVGLPDERRPTDVVGVLGGAVSGRAGHRTVSRAVSGVTASP